ncbi:MAG TPA: hypothetical protein VN238_00085 [Solirubrobacteraceae bacterium]|nr:hypothetical protein [Solirubrobacteraceae bacterium]
MRARDRDDVPAGAGAELGVAHGVVGIGDVLRGGAPAGLDEAVARAVEEHGAKAGRMLERFAGLPDGTLVWTCDAGGGFWLGRIDGPWRYDDGGAAAREAGLPHLRPAVWLDRRMGPDDVPAAVRATFGRGGRNLQRIRDAEAERVSAALARDLAG